MACGITLKRSLELDPHHSPEPNKRARHSFPHCSPLRVNPQIATVTSAASSSPFGHLGAPVSHEYLEAYIRSEIRRLRRRKLLPYARPTAPHSGDSPMRGADSPNSTGGQSGSDSEGDHGGPSVTPGISKAGIHGGNVPIYNPDQPLFSYKQVQLIAERLLQEQEAKLRVEYDRILNQKLAEQYDTFVKFAHDQIHQRLVESGANASYLS